MQNATSPSTGVKVGSTARAIPAVAARATMPASRLSRAASVQMQTRVVLPSGTRRSGPCSIATSRSAPRFISPSSPRGPAITEPSAASTSPAAFTTAIAETVSPAPVWSAA